MTHAELMERFAAASLETFTHRDHVRVAWLYLRREPFWAAVARFCADLQHFAGRAGRPGLYHETITWAYLLILHQRRHGRPPGETWDDFAAANADLLCGRPSVLERYYSAETLASDRARQCFVLPDRISAAAPRTPAVSP